MKWALGRAGPVGLALVLALATTQPLSAQFNVGDVFISMGNGQVIRHDQSGVVLQTLTTCCSGFVTGGAFDGSGNYYVTNFSGSQVSKFDNTGAYQGTVGSGYSTPESIVFDASGNMYVGNLGNGILAFNSAGTQIASYTAGRVDWMDLTSDQSTMYVTAEGSNIRRFDLATNSYLSDFATGLGGQAFALRILGDGGVLLANGGNVIRLDNTGTVTRTYVAGGGLWFSLNLDPDGDSFWTATTTGLVKKFDIDSGTELASWTGLNVNGTWGVSVYGEVTAGGPPPEPSVPEPSTIILLATGLLGLTAAGRRRRYGDDSALA